MSDRDGVFSRLRSRSEELLTQVSAELMSNPQFGKAVQQALKGKRVLDEAAAKALRRANIPSRTEFKRAERRVGELEAELAALRQRLEKIEKAGRTRGAAGKRVAGKSATKKKASASRA